MQWSSAARAIAKVSVVEKTAVASLLYAGTRVTGAMVRTADSTKEMTADLVVDASGRMSRTPERFKQMGYEPPAKSVVNGRLGYATRLYRRQPGARRDWEALYVQAAPPDHKRAGIVFPVEGNRWVVTLSGRDGDYAPVDPARFLDFARSLPDGRIAELIAASEPVTPIVGYRRMENRWRHYERLRRRPQRLVVLGDAACACNPVYGQEMTVAALGAATLANCLATSAIDGLAERFPRALARVIRTPWTLATGEDVRSRC